MKTLRSSGADRTDRDAVRDSHVADRLAMASLFISALALLASVMSAWTADRSLDFAHRTNAETQRTTMFIQFQSQFYTVTERFPPQYLDATFRPADGTNEFARLQAFWLLGFSEWYATHRVDQERFDQLWTGYYVPLIADALGIPSLRHVLETTIASGKLSHGDFGQFLQEVARIARQTGQPLAPAVEQRISRAMTQSPRPASR